MFQLLYDAPVYQSHLKQSRNTRQMSALQRQQYAAARTASPASEPTTLKAPQGGTSSRKGATARRRGGRKQYDKRANEAELIDSASQQKPSTSAHN